MSNFDYIQKEFPEIAEAARKAEGHITGDPRAACFHTRFALEAAVHWLYRHDNSLRMPYDRNLGALIYEPTFQNLLPEAVLQKAIVIQKVGNQAVHSQRPVREYDAMQVVKELHHICHWMVHTYRPELRKRGAPWNQSLVPRPVSEKEMVSRQKLEDLESELAKKHAEDLKQKQERDALDAELQELRRQLTEVREQARAVPDPHDYSEAETRHYLIDVDLHRAGWLLDKKEDREYPVTGMPNKTGEGFVDYVLWGDDGKPLGLVEAKKSTVDPSAGMQQAKLYADCLEAMHGQRPVIFYTNGYETWIWDDSNKYPPRRVAGFYKKDELSLLIVRRTQRGALDVARIKDGIVERYYQKRAIGSIFEQFTQSRRKALLVMATGTGKTRTAIALVDGLQKAGWCKRVLFLADRVSLVKQAVGAFKAHLPESSPVNLVTEKNTEGRVYVCTYPTMMGLINENRPTKESALRFGVGHFDLIIIDEAHRSVYQKYGAIFDYFDSFLVGLTATPREQVDKNTYRLFNLEPGVPTDAYELEKAVSDGFLVPPKVEQINLRFPREGIHYDNLTDEEKEQWESTDWGDTVEEGELPEHVNASAINSWLFNIDTVDKVLGHLMLHGHKVEGGDRLGKTVIFARNHDHAKFIKERFDHHYPHYAGHFARIIDNYEKYAQSLIDDFSQVDKDPHIAISVDMLDTGIDVPEILNLVFFKPVYSKIKFWQMIGRGTRLCPDLFGPGQDKHDFRVYDFCFNFDFFKENPQGIESDGSASLGVRLFRSRIELLGKLQTTPELDPDRALGKTLIDTLHGEVASMNKENFIVRMNLAAVERFKDRTTWDALNEDERETLQRDVAGLPAELKLDVIEARLFDLTVLRMQLALASGNTGSFEAHRKRVVEIAELLEEKVSIPSVAAQAAYIQAIQDVAFWEGINIPQLEEMRLRLRELVPLLDKKKRNIVYTDFRDEVMDVRTESPVYLTRMTGVQYEKKVKEYLRNHMDNIVIHKLRTNQPLTPTDLESLESMLQQIGEDDGKTLLSNLLKQSGSPSIVYFVRSLVGMDRATAQAAFSEFLNDRSLSTAQIRFIEMIIDQLTAHGFIDPGALYEAPFSDLHSEGPEALFAGKVNVIEGIFQKIETMQSEIEGA